MFFNPKEIIPKKIQVSPRICHGGELVALWIDAYGKMAATHIWDIAVARAFCNTGEIETAIAAEMERTGSDRLIAAKTMILRSGVYEFKEKPESKQVIELSLELALFLQSAADREGLSVEQYLQNLIANK
ncbi:MAG: hypothetical protein V7L23_29985 [Nostoc sp.]|uniref:hypothetical protein n=1 Tax=Nostoc sp. TaxID=1180 RepID=UPI002FF0C4BD